MPEEARRPVAMRSSVGGEGVYGQFIHLSWLTYQRGVAVDQVIGHGVAQTVSLAHDVGVDLPGRRSQPPP